MHDFSDNFVDQLKVSRCFLLSSEVSDQILTSIMSQDKIKIEHEVQQYQLQQNGSSGRSRLIAKRSAEPIKEIEGDENEPDESNLSEQLKMTKLNQAGLDQNGSISDKSQESVFKSANWLSDSELIFSLTNQVGGLVRALRIFQELDIGIKHVESRKSRRRESEFEIFVDIDCSDQEKMKKLIHHLR